MKNLLLVCLTMFLYTNLISAQINEDSGMSEFNLYLELGVGLASSASVNLEKHLASSTSGKIHWYGRAGFGGTFVFFGSSGLGGLGALTMLTGNGKHHFEVSGGVFWGNDNREYGGGFALPLLDLGYRFQKPGKGFVFRAKAGILGIGIGIGQAFQ